MSTWNLPLKFSSTRSQVAARPKEPGSPYFGLELGSYADITQKLLQEHPLDESVFREAALNSWEDIFKSTIGFGKIGRDIFPNPQIMGFLLHELIPIRIGTLFEGWRREKSKKEKDLVCEFDNDRSVEIKASSHRSWVYGNRSFGLPNQAPSKKAKDGYYLTVNFQRWADCANGRRPEITLVRFGWIDSTDWISQKAETGQNSSLAASVYRQQLAVIYAAEH